MKHQNALYDFPYEEDEHQLIKFAKIELDFITNQEVVEVGSRQYELQLFNQAILNVVETVAKAINDPILLNVLCAKLYNLRMPVDKNGIHCDELRKTIDLLSDSEDDEMKLLSVMITVIEHQISEVLEDDYLDGKSADHFDKLSGLALQRIIYLLSWIPLRTFKSVEDLEMIAVGGSEENGTIFQSSIAGRIYSYDKFSDVPYMSNAITFQRKKEDGKFEPYVCDESRLFVKFPIKSSHFIPVMIRVDENEKVFKLDRAKYKKLMKRIVSSQPRFLQK